MGAHNIGVAGEQGHHVLARLNGHSLHFVGPDDRDSRHLIGQGFPEVCEVHQVPLLKQLHIPEHGLSIPAPVGGNDAVGGDASNGHTGLTQHRRSIVHVRSGGSQIEG